jgi:hypothetical protein
LTDFRDELPIDGNGGGFNPLDNSCRYVRVANGISKQVVYLS